MMLAFLLAVTHFPGGSASEFAAALATAANGPVVIAQASSHAIPGLDFDLADRNEFNRILQKDAGLRMSPGVDLTLHDNLISTSHLPGWLHIGLPGAPLGVEPPTVATVPPAALRDGKVTLATEKGQLLSLEAIAGMPFSRKLQSHWYFAKLGLAINVKDLPEKDFLTLVGKAVGGNLASPKSGYELKLNVEEARHRILNTLLMKQKAAILAQQPAGGSAAASSGQVVANSGINLSRLKFLIATVQQLSTQQLGAVLEQDANETRIALTSGTGLTAAAEQRVRDYESEPVDQTVTITNPATVRARGRMQPPRINRILTHVDQNRTSYIILSSNLELSIEIPLVDNNGRPQPAIRVQ